MVRAAHVPSGLVPLFEQAEKAVEAFFSTIERAPERGTIHVGGERYVLMRGESLYLALYSALSSAFGDEASREFLYSTAREIGMSDATAFIQRIGVDASMARMASGPIHFSHCGWGFVHLFEDTNPDGDGTFLHYSHPNTFESEVTLARRGRVTQPACMFSAGYSAGWCTRAFSRELHAREISCLACGDARCEFVMSPFDHLDENEAKVKSARHDDSLSRGYGKVGVAVVGDSS